MELTKTGKAQAELYLHRSTREQRQDLATRGNRLWDSPFAFSGEQGVLLISSKKPFIFDLVIADSALQDLPRNTAGNPERSQTSRAAPGQQMLEQMKPSREERAATRRSE